MLEGSEARVAIVTGAGSGIGRAVALAMHAAGFHVVMAGRGIEKLETTASQGANSGADMVAISTDVSKPDSVLNLFQKVQQRFGRLDVLFNNAGTGLPPMPIEEISYEQWTRVVDVNLTGAFLCAREAVKVMKCQTPQGGRIINNGSISAHVPRPNSAAYTATKHAITGLTRSLSLDGRAYDIACSQIDIGNAATDLTQGIRNGALQPNGTLLAEPCIDVKIVADAVLYMANLPLHANVQFMTIMATQMPYIGRG